MEKIGECDGRCHFVDKTMMTILSLRIGGAGLFASLTKFNVPELNMTFLDSNPYAIKRDDIDYVMTWIFTGLTLLGVLLGIVGELLGDKIPSRRFSGGVYGWFTVASLLFLVCLVWGLTS